MKIQIKWVLLFVAFALIAVPVMSADSTDPNLGEGAAVGASTNVLGDAAAESLVSPELRRQPWWTTLKRAFTGAATGAIAAKTSGGRDEPADDAAAVLADWLKTTKDENLNAKALAAKAERKKREHDDDDGHEGHKHHGDGDHGMDAEGHRPPGWSKGKKKGWGDGDMPPGLMKKKNKGKHHDHEGHDHGDHDED